MRTYSKRVKDRAPCLNCPDREPGCHGKCELYAEWRRPFEVAKDAKRKNVDADSFRHEGVKKCINRRYKQNG